MTVEELLKDGFPKGKKVYLETAWGLQEVTSIRMFSDGPWLVCGKENGGFGLSYSVSTSRKLEVKS